jgi:hypothetical protein
MKIRIVISALALLLTGTLSTALLVRGESATEAFLPQQTFTVQAPAANCCLWQIHKRARGERAISFGAAYGCDTGRITPGLTKIQLRLTSEGAPCDQSLLIPNNSLLEATGWTDRRTTDNFAYFGGKFTIKNPAGVVLFEGAMEAMDRIGTHHPPFGAEACNPQAHLEGWLTGRGSSLLPNHSLRAFIVAGASLPAGAAAAPMSASIDGTLIKCP